MSQGRTCGSTADDGNTLYRKRRHSRSKSPGNIHANVTKPSKLSFDRSFIVALIERRSWLRRTIKHYAAVDLRLPIVRGSEHNRGSQSFHWCLTDRFEGSVHKLRGSRTYSAVFHHYFRTIMQTTLTIARAILSGCIVAVVYICRRYLGNATASTSFRGPLKLSWDGDVNRVDISAPWFTYRQLEKRYGKGLCTRHNTF